MIIRAVIIGSAVGAALLCLGTPVFALELKREAILTGPAAVQGETALKTIYKIKCIEGGLEGTGFLYKPRLIITAAHVVEKCTNVRLIDKDGIMYDATKVAESKNLDLASLRPKKEMPGRPLPMSATDTVAVGTTVTMWGFPGGYGGTTPLLSVGYISGYDVCQGSRDRLIINGAINHGVSGGPIIDTTTGTVIGVSVAKLVPLNDFTMSELTALHNDPNGFQYTATLPNNVKRTISINQVTADIAYDLASQVQLVIGCAVTAADLRSFVSYQ